MRIIARLDIKSENLIKGIQFEGLRVIGNPNEYAIARPCLIDLKGELYLFYCKRETEFSKDYMIFTKKINNNKISIPEKKDNLLIINSLNDKNFQECQCYPYIIKYNNYLILFYNGLNYGKTGFRIAYKKI